MDGGRTALAGYLYQIVGVLGMVGRADCPDDDKELEALLTLVREGELLHERFDQDAVVGIHETDECVLVQFKYSRQATPPKIRPTELIQIVKKLIISERSAKSFGQSVTAYVLITNREIGPKSEEVIQAAKKKREHKQIKTIPKKEKKYDTITKDEQCEVLEQLRLITDIPQAKWYDDLRQFTRLYGAEDHEIKDGVDRLIGQLVGQTVEKGFCEVVKADLIEALIGHREARPLTSEATLEYTQKQLSDFSEALGLLGEPVRRELLDEISTATFERALVILHGRGGSGKTVTLWHWLREQPTNLKVMELTNSVPYPWIIELICDWCNLPANHARRSQSRERALSRLQIANSEAPKPLLYLGLDGLDENIVYVEQVHRIREILRWFWEEDKKSQDQARAPRATLVVTCRDAEEVINKWLQLGRSGFRYPGQLPITIEVDDFSSNELLRAVELGVPELFERFKASIEEDSHHAEELIGSFDSPIFGAATTISISTSRFAPLITPEVLSSLSHPAMWRALLELAAQTQAAVLDGKVDAIDQLAHEFVLWFCRKSRVRGVSDLELEDLLLILKDIACYTKNNPHPSQTDRQWIEPACASDMLNRQEAKKLLFEAISAGLIERDESRRWRWRHELVVDYLVVAEIN